MYRTRALKDPHPVSFSTPTPKERVAEAQVKRDSSPWDAPRIPLFPSQIITNDNNLSIQVEFYTHITKIQRRTLPDMQGSVALEPNRSLDTRKLMLLWGLETCVPVNPEKLIPMYTYELRRTDIIPKQALVKLIGKRGTIAFVEWEDVTKLTARKREVREIYWRFTTSLSILYNVYASFIRDILDLLPLFSAFASLTQVLEKTCKRVINVVQPTVSRACITFLLPVGERYHRMLRCLYVETGIAEAVRDYTQMSSSEGTLTMIALFGVFLFGFWAFGYGF